MEKGLSVNKKIKLLKELRSKWSLNNIKKLKLEDYSRYIAKDKVQGKSSTFVYDIEFGSFNKVASIGQARSNVRCIYGHQEPAKSKNMKSDDEYSWYEKYGNDRNEAWKNIKQELISLLQTCKDNEKTDNFDWVFNKSCILGQNPNNITNFKKAIIFMNQKSNINETTLVPIFNDEILEYYFDYNNLKPISKDYYNLQIFLISKYKITNIKQAIKKSEEIWKLWEDKNIRYSKKDEHEIKDKDKKRLEGAIQESLVLSYKRNVKTVYECKERDNYTCQSCSFLFDNKIVEAHHLEPLYLTGETKIGKDDLITLCPTCHKVAHYLLNKDESLITKDILIPEIKIILDKAYKN